MKKKILSILLLFVSILMNAQPPVDNLNKLSMNPQKIKPGILSDKMDSENKRIIYGKAQMVNNREDEDAEKILLGKPVPTAIATQAFYKAGTYGITLNMVRVKKRSIPTNARVLIKTQKDSVIETTVLEGCMAEETLIPVVNISMVTQPYSEPRYKMFCHISLDADMINQIYEEGIVKMRIQTDQDYYDIELKKDNISQFYYEELLLIEKAVKTKKGDFTDGF